MRRPCLADRLSKQHRGMFDIAELPQAGPPAACALFGDGVWRIDRQAVASERGKGEAGRYHQVGKVDAVLSDRKIADRLGCDSAGR